MDEYFTVYIPSTFAVTDPAKLAALIESNSFATLVSKDADSLFASHLPFLYRPAQGAHGTLLSHMARANRHWKLFETGGESLVIFTGLHAYISPTFYAAEVAVPTWNYANVHIYGIAKIVESDTGLDAILDETISKHESGCTAPWTSNLPPEMRANLKKAIVGFEIEITRIEGKFKLGQNRSTEDREKMLAILQSSPDTEVQRLATLMERELREPTPQQP